jgi:DNA-binding CsgD family transcriptional regulator
MHEALFDGVISRFYEAAILPEMWPEALQSLAEASGSRAAVMHFVGAAEPSYICSSALSELLSRYRSEGWYLRNSRMETGLRLVARGWRGVLTERDAFTEDELKRDPFSQEFARPHGFFPYAGAAMRPAPGVVVPLVIERAVGEGSFERHEVVNLNRLFAHLGNACEFAARYAVKEASSLIETLATNGQPLALVGPEGRLQHANEAFEAFFGDVLFLTGGRLRARLPADTRKLSQAMAAATKSNGVAGAHAVLIAREPPRQGVLVRMLPLARNARDLFRLGRAIVSLADLDSHCRPSERELRHLFKLTAAEARLASALGQGQQLDDIAGTEGVTVETARSRLKSIFAKMGVHRQAELALLVAKLAGAFSQITPI